MAVVISTVSTVSEQERNGQGRFLNAIANLRMILFYLRQLLSMTQIIINYSLFLFLHKLLYVFSYVSRIIHYQSLSSAASMILK